MSNYIKSLITTNMHGAYTKLFTQKTLHLTFFNEVD